MRKYTVEEKTLKMKMGQKEHDRRTDYLEARFFELQADRRAAEIFVLDIPISKEVHGQPLRMCRWLNRFSNAFVQFFLSLQTQPGGPFPYHIKVVKSCSPQRAQSS